MNRCSSPFARKQNQISFLFTIPDIAGSASLPDVSPMVPCASSPVTRVSRSPLFATEVRKRNGISLVFWATELDTTLSYRARFPELDLFFEAGWHIELDKLVSTSVAQKTKLIHETYKEEADAGSLPVTVFCRVVSRPTIFTAEASLR